MRRRWFVLLLAVLASSVCAETISHGRFDPLTLYRPQGEARQTVLFFSGGRGWTAELDPIAQSLVRQGALVAGIDTPAFIRNLEQDGGKCVSPEGDLENLSHFVQAYVRSSTYRPALLVGSDAGSVLVYAMLAQAPAGTFGGGLSLGFCPTQVLKKPLCPSGKPAAAPQLGAPWTVLQGINDEQCRTHARQFLADVKRAEVIAVPGDGYGEGDFHTWEPQFAGAFRRLAANTHDLAPAGAAALKDLPIIEVHSKNGSDTLAVLISGDGGWAGIDKALASALSQQGVPVVGLDSLRYFWKARTPESTAADVDRLLRHYLTAWKKRSVVLIGFSQGADVMPFIVNRLPAATRERLKLVALLSLSDTAVFEFHLQNWFGAAKNAVPVTPELLRMKGVRGLCVYGADETDSLCAQPAANSLQVVKVSGGHHFDGNYARLASLLMSHMH